MEQATLTIQHKMQTGTKYSIYKDLFKCFKEGETFEKVVQEQADHPDDFGSVRFLEDFGSVYYEHIPNDRSIYQHQLSFSMDIPPEWFYCFSFAEMRVVGLDMGVFEAQTTVDLAMQRLQWLDVNYDSPLYHKKNELYVWLKKHARLEDRIRLCSDWIYYHPNGKYDYDFVRLDINKRIAMLKKHVDCSHWKKQAS